jgi:hypothetical protein
MRSELAVIAAIALTLPLGGCAQPANDAEGNIASEEAAAPAPAGPAAGTPEWKIENARSAAPDAIAAGATIMDWPADSMGQPTQLQAGTNGWTCFPTTPAVAGAPGEDPMCLDAAAMTWANAWMARTPPKLDRPGFAYMLKGDKGASNTDPFATGPTADNQWVQTGPHVMILPANPKELDGLSADAASGGPYVMWQGTPWAHVMFPVAPAM